MVLKKRIIKEPVSQIREAARAAMRGRLGILFTSSALYALCLTIPIIVVEQITGFWDVFERAIEDYTALLFANPSYEAINEWYLAYSDKLSPSIATLLFLLIVPGPIELGISSIWLRVMRGKEAYTDMVFSGFGNLLRAVLLNLIRGILIALWSILLIIPGIVAYYRYNLAFFLLADNPGMSPFAAITYSKAYMQENKSSRFILDLSFIGWFAIAVAVNFLLNSAILSAIEGAGNDISLFTQYIISYTLNAIILAPVFAYRGVASADFYHRVICRDPKSYTDVPILPG